MSHGKERLTEQASDFAGVVKEQAVAMGETVKDKAVAMSGTVTEKASELAGATKEHVQQWSAQTQSAARRAISDAGERAGSVMGQTSAAIEDARRSVSKAAASVTSGTSSMGREWVRPVQTAINDAEPRDKLLLGAAGVAVLVALSIAYQRRLSERAEG